VRFVVRFEGAVLRPSEDVTWTAGPERDPDVNIVAIRVLGSGGCRLCGPQEVSIRGAAPNHHLTYR
jgi:hypothetical protein